MLPFAIKFNSIWLSLRQPPKNTLNGEKSQAFIIKNSPFSEKKKRRTKNQIVFKKFWFFCDEQNDASKISVSDGKTT